MRKIGTVFRFPYCGFFEWLNGEDLPKKFNSENLFHSFMLSNTFNENLVKKININDYKCEYKWDGIRAQIIISSSEKFTQEMVRILLIHFLS